MRVSVGSENPAKLHAAEMALKALGIKAELVSIKVPSGVKSQPMSNNEGIKGAINRARASMAKSNAQIGIGMEGTVDENEYGMFLTGWAAVVDENGQVGIGNSAGIALPEKIAKRIRSGEELGDVIEEIENSEGIRKDYGTMGVLTKGLIRRDDEFYSAIIMAFAPIINKKYYV